MKAILFFVASGRILDSHKATATALAEKTGKKVVFRNASIPLALGENPEPCEGVFGKVPEAYAAAFPTYAEDGSATPPAGAEAPETPIGEVNALGLPKGCPDDRNALKDALEAEGVEFHPNMKTDKLVDLFRSTVLARQEAAGA